METRTIEVGSGGDPAAPEALRMELQACALGERELPGQVLIAPWGEVASASGSFVVDGEGGRAVVAAFTAHGTDLPIDFEHQSLGGAYASPNGLAPAAGWIRGLRLIEPGQEGEAGLWAEVDWTAAGRERLAAREYRYLSPVVLVRKADRRVISLHSAALTNKPAIAGMRPIVNAMREAAAEEAMAVDLTPLRGRLGLEAGAGVAEVLVAADARLAAMDDVWARREAEERVGRVASEGKLPAALREWAMTLAMRAPALFDQWAAAAPVLVVTGRTRAPDAGTASPDVAIIASARQAYRSEPGLASLTSEEAFIADALREAHGARLN